MAVICPDDYRSLRAYALQQLLGQQALRVAAAGVTKALRHRLAGGANGRGQDRSGGVAIKIDRAGHG